MSDQKKNKAQLMQELQALRHQMAELQQLASERGWAGAMLAGDRQSEQLLRSIIDATPDWIFVKDQEHRYRLANQGYANALHLEPQDFIGKDDLDLGFPEELVKGNPEKGIRGFWADDRLVMDSGQPQVYPNDPATIDGVVHTFHTIKTPLRDAEGKVWGVLAFARDITERERVQEALRESEEKYRKILENIEEGYYEVDLAGSLTFFNDSLCRLYGYSRDELMGMNYRQYMDNEIAQVVYQTYNTVYRTGKSATAIDWVLIRKDGTRRFIEVSVALMHGPTGEPVGFRGTIRDTTERKQTELLLSKRVKELDCLNDIGRRIEETPSAAEFLRWVTERIPSAMQYPDQCLVAVEFEGQVYGKAEALKLPCQMVGGLHVGSEQVGRLCVAYTQEHDFLNEESALLGSVVRRVSGYIENARLFEETRTRAEELAALNEMSRALSASLSTDAAIESIYRYAARLMDTTNFYVALYDSQKDEVSFPLYAEGELVRPLAGRRRTGQGMTEHVIQTRAPLLIAENVSERIKALGIELIGRDSQSWLGVPMMIGERVTGVLAVQSYTTPRLYDEHHRDLLSAVASQAAIAIENARQFEQVHARAKEMVALNELSRALATALSVPQLLEEIHQGVSRLLDTTNFYIALYDPERHEVSFAINVSESVADREIVTLPADQGITGYIIRTRESVLVKSDVNGWLAERSMPHVGEPAQSWLGVPLMLGAQVLGVMAIQDYKTPNVYDEHDRDLMVTIASQAAIALQNARSFEQAQAHARREQALREITARVRGSTDPDAIVRAAVRELGAALGRPAFVRLGSAEQLAHSPSPQESGDGRQPANEGGK